MGAGADLGVVQDNLRTSLDLRWPGKVASQMTRHDTTMAQLQVTYFLKYNFVDNNVLSQSNTLIVH